MKILLINNQTKHLDELSSCFKKHQLTVVSMTALKKIHASNFDAIILSGGSKYAILSHLDIYNDEINLIKDANKPILGICLGFELICYAFDELLKFRKEKIKKEIELSLSDDELFKNIKSPIKVQESHRWIVPKTSFLINLAESEMGVEVVKHPNKLIYGLQFHPESKTNQHKRLIDNFLEKIKNASQLSKH